VNHLTLLNILNASEDSGITQNGIFKLQKLISLNVEDNRKIHDVNHLTLLSTLNASGKSGIIYIV